MRTYALADVTVSGDATKELQCLLFLIRIELQITVLFCSSSRRKPGPSDFELPSMALDPGVRRGDDKVQLRLDTNQQFLNR